MLINRLSISSWRQFAEVDIVFHPRLTVIAGANGAGKSTLLRILSQHFGVQHHLLATPKISSAGVLKYFSGLFGFLEDHEAQQQSVGEIEYGNGEKSTLQIPTAGAVQYNLKISNMQPVPGLFINSHRPVNSYQSIESIPTNAISAEQAYQSYHQEIANKYNNAYSQYSPTYRIKEAIISMATFGPGNKNVQRNPDLEGTYEDFKVVLSKVLPSAIGFRDISVRVPDVVIVTDTGEFVLDAASGGLMALIDIAWQIFLYSRGRPSFAVVIDEPENHLHPSMQRSIIGTLLEAFPNTQFITATHSPFIVSSVRNSAVYVLRHSESLAVESPQSIVTSEKLENVNKSGTASEVLRGVLGVPVTMPIWAEAEIESIASEFDINALDAASIAALRARLGAAGLGDYYADALARMA